MNTIKIDKKGVQLVAHRGCSGLERENTASSFVAAGNRSYWGIESDVHKTVDGKYVIIHDDTTGRVAIDDMDALTLAEEAGTAKAVNLVLLGRLSRYFDFTREEWMAAIEKGVPAKFLEVNKKAFTLGATM